MDPKPVHLLEAAMQFNDTHKQFVEDMLINLARSADVVGITESDWHRHNALIRVCRASDYRLVHPVYPDTFPVLKGKQVGCALMVQAEHQILASGWVPVIDGLDRPASQGGHDPRGYTWAKLKIRGERVFVAQFHMLTAGRIDQPGRRQEQNERYVTVGRQLVKVHSHGHRLGFLMGDSNDPQFQVPGMTSIWDEQQLDRRTPDPICTVLSWDLDGRVKGVKVRHWPQGNSDHAAFSAFYELRERAEEA